MAAVEEKTRYSEDELKEFETIITQKLEATRNELNFIRETLSRKNDNGTVIIQVSQLQHPIVQLVQQHDYFGFYNFEIQNRKHFSYPPFSRLMSLLFKHKENNIAEEAANHFLHSLTPEMQKTVLGPAQPIVNRVRNKYIWELAIKISKQPQQLQLAKKQLLHYIRLLQVHPRYKSVNIIIDIDPN